MRLKLVFIVGMLSLIAIVLGALLKILHYAGSETMLTMGIITFMLVFIPALSLSLWRKPTADKPLLATLATGMILIGTSVLFKLMHLTGAQVMLILGLGIVALIVIPLLFNRLYRFSKQ